MARKLRKRRHNNWGITFGNHNREKPLKIKGGALTKKVPQTVVVSVWRNGQRQVVSKSLATL